MTSVIDSIIVGVFTLTGSLLGVYLTLKHSLKIESRRLALSLLIEKKMIIERLIKDCAFNYRGMEEDESNIQEDYKKVSDFIRLKFHYFTDSNEFTEIKQRFLDIEKDFVRNEDYNPQLELYDMSEINDKIYKFIKKELSEIMRRLKNFNTNKVLKLC
jgi:hypothetical protein